MRGTVGALACAAFLLIAPQASAQIESVFDGAIQCQTQDDGSRYCGGGEALVATWDGQLIDVNVALPPAPESGPDGPYPLVGHFHGYGGSKIKLDDNNNRHELRRWTDQGYAAFAMSARGFGPCGAKPLVPLRCLNGGHVRLMDTRFEVRDAQHLMGMLVDDGVADPGRLASAGGSYGGGMSMALAALKNRTMLPNGSLEPWTSPDGTPISLAAAIPEIPWTDLAYALLPNGRTLDYVADAPYLGPDGDAAIGVMKASFVTGLYASGVAAGLYAAPGTDPEADLTLWYALITKGEPYELPPIPGIVEKILKYHSSYYIDHSVPPAPLLISNGWTDDIFPADEAIRFYNRTRAEHPGADISLFFLDSGHQRGQNKGADLAHLTQRQNAFLAHHLKGEPAPQRGVTTLTQTCPGSESSGGPYHAPQWSEIAPGEVRLEPAGAQTILPLVGTDALGPGAAYDPIAGPGACATASGDDQIGAASYRLAPAPEGGFTLMGSPTVIADFNALSPTTQVAARLLDVAPDGQATLVARGLWRPRTGGSPVREVFQLHPNGYKFAAEHVAKLELLPADAPYSRPSNAQLPVIVQDLELRLPVLEDPGAAGGLVAEPEPKIVPDGYALAPGFEDGEEPGPPGEVPTCRGEEATIAGGPGDDVLPGTPKRDVIVGGAGADEIRGKGGADLICAGPGADHVLGGKGADQISGGAGEDRLYGGRGPDRINGGPGNDLLRGGRGADVLRGGPGRNDISGGPGRDRIDGKRERPRGG